MADFFFEDTMENQQPLFVLTSELLELKQTPFVASAK